MRPAAVCWLLISLPAHLANLRADLRERTSPSTPAIAPDARREQYGKDLRRLAVDHEKLRGGDKLTQGHRLQAIQRAYDETLREACLAFEIDTPDAEFDDAARLQVEADLLVRGVTW